MFYVECRGTEKTWKSGFAKYACFKGSSADFDIFGLHLEFQLFERGLWIGAIILSRCMVEKRIKLQKK